MNVALWIGAGLLAAVFVSAGAMKVSMPKAKIAAAGLGWVEDFPLGVVKLIGGLEVLAAIGLILPGVTGIAPIIVPLAASGLIALMIGAAITHTRRKEYSMIVVNVVLLLLAGFIAWGRFGPYPL